MKKWLLLALFAIGLSIQNESNAYGEYHRRYYEEPYSHSYYGDPYDYGYGPGVYVGTPFGSLGIGF